MRRLLYVLAGFVVGVVVARNAAVMHAPTAGAVVLGVAVGLVLAWLSGSRDKASAVAVAVARAQAVAVAASDARAAAIAQASVHVHMEGAGEVPAVGGARGSGAPARVGGRHVAGEIDGQVPVWGSWSVQDDRAVQLEPR